MTGKFARLSAANASAATDASAKPENICKVDRVHELGPYDLEVDTTDRDPAVVAAEVIRH